MHKLGEGEATMTKEEYTKMKQELEAYVATVTHTHTPGVNFEHSVAPSD